MTSYIMYGSDEDKLSFLFFYTFYYSMTQSNSISSRIAVQQFNRVEFPFSAFPLTIAATTVVCSTSHYSTGT